MRGSYDHVQVGSGGGLALQDKALQLQLAASRCLELLYCCRRSELHRTPQSGAQGFAGISEGFPHTVLREWLGS